MEKVKSTIYKRRVIDDILAYIKTDDVLVLHGARQVGKTHIMKWLQDYLIIEKEPVFYIDLEYPRFVQILNNGADEMLKLLAEEGFDVTKRVYVFIDEIQYLENPSSLLKIIADHYKNIKLIVSGSSSFEIKSKFKDSLVGRTINFEIFNLSFEEFLQFKEVFFDRDKVFTEKKTAELVMYFKEYALYGGYPKVVLEADLEIKERYLQQIIDTYLKKDIRDLADVRDIGKFNGLLEVLASQSGNILNVLELSKTCGLSVGTVERYLFILENTYIIKLVRPYSKNIRTELFRAPKIFFYDTALMQLLWLKQFQKEVVGSVFETAIFVELVKKYGRENVFFWRTKDKKEIDFVVKIKNKVLPIEVKLNFSKASLRSINFFNENYENNDYMIVALAGDKKGDYQYYPWEV